MKGEIVTRNPNILGGVPVFSGTRVPTRILTEHLEAGDSLEEFLDQFPSVRRYQAVEFAACSKGHANDDMNEIAS